MLIFHLFFTLLILTSTAAWTISSPEDGNAPKRTKRLAQENNRLEKSNKGHRAQGARGPQGQGQATSSAYADMDSTIHIDLARDNKEGLGSGSPEHGSSKDEKGPGQSKYSIASGLSVKPISPPALNIAKAKHELKKKLQADNKKKFRLQDVSGEKGPKDPREEIINELMKASEDIEK